MELIVDPFRNNFSEPLLKPKHKEYSVHFIGLRYFHSCIAIAKTILGKILKSGAHHGIVSLIAIPKNRYHFCSLFYGWELEEIACIRE
jgi:hypothetical protein